MRDHFTNKGVGAVYTFRGEIGNVPLHLITMKEEDYVMMLISAYGGN